MTGHPQQSKKRKIHGTHTDILKKVLWADPASFLVTLSPTGRREDDPALFEYMDIEIRDEENPDNVRHAFFANDGTLYGRLTVLVSPAEAAEIIERLRRGETIRLPGRFTKQQLVDMSAYRVNERTA